MMLRYTAYSLNNSLPVAAKILDVTDPNNPTQVATVAMIPTINGTYFLNYEAPVGKEYLANMMVYIDDTYVTPDPNYTPGDAQIKGPETGACPTAQSVIGLVNNPANAFGVVNNPNNIAGFVNCDCD